MLVVGAHNVESLPEGNILSVDAKTVNRISYGVIFQYQQEIEMTTQIWSHVFIVKLPAKMFEEELDFLRQLNIGETPAKALCMRGHARRILYRTNRFNLLP
jgi:hypothetical protein